KPEIVETTEQASADKDADKKAGTHVETLKSAPAFAQKPAESKPSAVRSSEKSEFATNAEPRDAEQLKAKPAPANAKPAMEETIVLMPKEAVKSAPQATPPARAEKKMPPASPWGDHVVARAPVTQPAQPAPGPVTSFGSSPYSNAPDGSAGHVQSATQTAQSASGQATSLGSSPYSNAPEGSAGHVSQSPYSKEGTAGQAASLITSAPAPSAARGAFVSRKSKND